MNEEMVFNPTRLDISRSVFPVKRNDKGTGFVGRLNVLRPFEVLPGSTWDLSCSNLIRFTTPVNPTMDNLYLDVYAYYTSNEMLLRRQSFSPNLNDGNHSFAAIMGAQDGFINMPYPDASLKIPAIDYMVGSRNNLTTAEQRVFTLQMSLLDQLGYPVLCSADPSDEERYWESDCFSCLALLGYISIWNEDFREPNLQNRFALTINNGYAKFTSDTEFYTCIDSDVEADLHTSAYGTAEAPIVYDSSADYGGSGISIVLAEPFGVSRFHGLFGSLLPFPQRNADPVLLPLGELAPVITKAEEHTKTGALSVFWRNEVTGFYPSSNRLLGAGVDGKSFSVGTNDSIGGGLFPTNLYADLSTATSASINTIRVAFQTQKWFEALARGGNGDLDEYINSIFGVVGPTDVEAKRPVYLGGKRIPVSISQVNNTGSDTGETGAFSLTTDDDHYVKWHSKSYGLIFFVFCIRFADSFADAPQKFLYKRSKFDFYAPQFANLGEEPYRASMLGANDAGVFSDELDTDNIIGYQEYAADYRYDVNAFSGQLRFGTEATWHYGNWLDTKNLDLASWLDASAQAMTVDRTLKVSGKTAYMQFMYDFYVYGKKYLPMPVNSIPGLVDHH